MKTFSVTCKTNTLKKKRPNEKHHAAKMSCHYFTSLDHHCIKCYTEFPHCVLCLCSMIHWSFKSSKTKHYICTFYRLKIFGRVHTIKKHATIPDYTIPLQSHGDFLLVTVTAQPVDLFVVTEIMMQFIGGTVRLWATYLPARIERVGMSEMRKALNLAKHCCAFKDHKIHITKVCFHSFNCFIHPLLYL